MDDEYGRAAHLFRDEEDGSGDDRPRAGQLSAAGALRDGIVEIFAYDACGACIARDTRTALSAYTGVIDLIDALVCRRFLSVRRIVAEQRGEGYRPTRWTMAYDTDGNLIEALEQTLGGVDSAPAGLLDSSVRLTRRLRWIGAPGAAVAEQQDP